MDSDLQIHNSLYQYMQENYPTIEITESDCYEAQKAADIALETLAQLGYMDLDHSDDASAESPRSATTLGDGLLDTAHIAMDSQTLRQRSSSLQSSPGSAGSATVDMHVPACSADMHTPACSDSPTPIVMMPVLKDPVVAPFSQDTIGLNLVLSEDGYQATRSCGCRESAAIGSGPLQRQALGLYFEVRVLQTVNGWLGGLGIGVTHTPATRLQRIPDKAWRIPDTFIAGYAGSAYLSGKEHRCAWEPEALTAGQRVGCLITGNGREDMVIYVDGAEVLRVDGSGLLDRGLRHEPLYPVVDVFNATLAVELLPHATAPRPS